MGSYSFVIPVSWERLTQHIFPAWRKVLSKSQPLDEFSSLFDLKDVYEVPFVDKKYQNWDSIPENYFQEVAWQQGQVIFPADNLRDSPKHALIVNEGLAEAATWIFAEVIRRSAVVEPARLAYFTRTRWDTATVSLTHLL